MNISRRDFLKLGLAGSAGLMFSGCGLAAGNNTAQSSAGLVLKSAARLPEPFGVPLPVPPVKQPARILGGVDFYEISQRVAKLEILPETKTEVWGYDGIFPGPTIEARRGRPTVVTHTNELPVPTVVHLHGGVVPPAHDGYPTDLVAPLSGGHGGQPDHHGRNMHIDIVGEGYFDYEYPNDQRAATLWYHDHRMDFTGPQVYRGLAGFHIIRDDEEDALGLPAGEKDVPVMISDRSFGEDGSFLYPSVDPSLTGAPGVEPEYMSGVLGDCILVNGAPWPYMEVSNTMYRFRFLNASNARRYRLALDPAPPGGESFVQVGSDQGLTERPIPHRKLDIAQAERFDVVIDFSAYSVGDEVTLVNEYGSEGTGQVMRFVVARSAREDARIPQRLSEIRRLTRSDAVIERDFNFARGGARLDGMDLWTVNGEPFEVGRTDARPELGTVELWRVRAQNVEHPFHIHLAPFQVLTSGGRDGAGPYNAGWKDTVNLDSGEEAEILVEFGGYTGKYVFHCHNLEHEDMMMMANFEVV